MGLGSGSMCYMMVCITGVILGAVPAHERLCLRRVLASEMEELGFFFHLGGFPSSVPSSSVSTCLLRTFRSSVVVACASTLCDDIVKDRECLEPAR